MARDIIDLKQNWQFTRDDDPNSMRPDFDASAWKTVRVPHDWAIAGPFDKEHDIQRIIQKQADVEVGVREITGRTGGLPHVGIGWYRHGIVLPVETVGRIVRLEVDGAMSHSQVYCNGSLVGTWPYGYSSFAMDLTDFITPGSENVIAIRLENPPLSSRWYPGGGLYRHVRLVVLDSVHVDHWGTCLTTPEVTADYASVLLKTTVRKAGGTAAPVVLKTEITAPDGQVVCSSESTAEVDDTHEFAQGFYVVNPKLWQPGSPALYKAVTTVHVADKPVDHYETSFGLRSLDFHPEKGFFINGQSLKMNGVCMHHDLGPLGAAINRTALKRQLSILQEMGCNAIRTSHNPPTPELLDLCDEMGFLVIDEAFDEWKTGKMENGYHRHFEAWAEKDLRAMIRRDRNHPCVILWSIGNEIMEQGQENGHEVARFLHNICHDEDPTRLTTAGFNMPRSAIQNGLADAIDVPGWNYSPNQYVRFHQRFPHKPMYGSETESTVSSRGEYYFPVLEEVSPIRETLQVNSFDMSYPGWAYSPDVEFYAQDECSFIMGEFVWTGFDYLGEPTPYSEEWPSRSSYFGIVDLCGIPKDRYYLYQSKWTEKQVLHLLPHWTWPGHEGEPLSVHCYTSFKSVELFVNGRSLGRQNKNIKAITGRYRVVWPTVAYEPGELKVVGYDPGGNVAAETVVRTAGAPAAITLTPDREAVTLDGEDMVFVTVRIHDADGNLCPTADDLVRFSISGPAEIAAVDNGNAASLESFHADFRKTFNGLCMVYLRSRSGERGPITLTAEGDALASASVTIQAVPADVP